MPTIRKMQISESKLKTHRGMTVGIGRVKIPKTSDFDYEIPLLSFIVIAEDGGDGYISSCIHLQIDGYGKTMEDARRDMLDNILYFLDKNFNSECNKDHCWENLLDLFEANENSSVFWDSYHAFQISFAEQGRTTDRYSQLLKELVKKIEALEDKIKELERENREKELEDQARNQNRREDCKGSKFMNTLKATNEMPIVEYIQGWKGVA